MSKLFQDGFVFTRIRAFGGQVTTALLGELLGIGC